MMLRHVGLTQHADRIETATFNTLKERKVTSLVENKNVQINFFVPPF